MNLLQKNLRHLYATEFINGLVAVMVPVLILFFMVEVGLSLTEILLSEAIFALTILLFEVPSGYIADRWGRKKAMIFAEISFFLAFALLTIADGLELVILGQILAGIGLACASGAKDALLYDSLKTEGQAEHYRKIRGRFNTFLFTTSVFSNIAGGLIASEFGLRSVIILSTGFIMLNIINVSFLKEPPIHRHKEEDIPLRKSWRYVRKHPLVRQIVLFSIVIGVGMKLSFQTLNPYWVLMEVPLVLFGFAMAFHNLVAAGASLFVDKLKQWTDFYVLMALTCLVSGVFLFMATEIQFPVIVVIVLGSLFQIARAWWPVITEDAVNQVTYSQHRATVLSIKSFARQLGQALVLPIFGYAADWWSLFTAFGLLGIIIFVLGSITLWPL